MEFQKQQVVRVIETHEANGVMLHKGTIGYVYDGETYGTLATDEIPVVFTFINVFLGVSKSKLEPFKGDLPALAAKASAHEKLENRLRDIQQKYQDFGNPRMVEIIKEMRKYFHTKSMAEILGYDTDAAAADFETSECSLKEAGIRPYGIHPKSNTSN